VQLCSDLLGEERLVGMGYNNGAGPADQTTCTAMASRFERWMEHHVSGHSVDSDLRVTKERAFVTEQREQRNRENPDLETESPYQVDEEHLKQWIEFLRHCGGFEVWCEEGN
jgi:hypothetical protein